MDRTLPDDLTIAQASLAWGGVIVFGVCGFVLALWPQENVMPTIIRGNNFGNIKTGIKADHMKNVDVVENISNADTFIDAKTIEGGKIARNVLGQHGAAVYQNNGVNNGHMGPIIHAEPPPNPDSIFIGERIVGIASAVESLGQNQYRFANLHTD